MYPSGRPAVLLPTAPVPRLSLAEALRRQKVPPGAATGPVPASHLGTLLWYALAAIGSEPGLPPSIADRSGGPHRHSRPRGAPGAPGPYSAAGTRLRLLARGVAGLADGRYEADPIARALWYVAPAPRFEDGVAVAPDIGPVLGIYVNTGAEAVPPQALLEAGRLAQNLSLVAVAVDLAVVPMPALPDGYAKRLLALGDPADVPVYLMLVARADPQRAGPTQE